MMGIASLNPSYKHGPLHLCLMKVPLLSSATACCSSALVFITIGPYQATGSSMRLARDQEEPDAVVAGLDRDLVAAVEQHQRAVAGALAHQGLAVAVSFSVSTPNGFDAPENVPEPSNT